VTVARHAVVLSLLAAGLVGCGAKPTHQGKTAAEWQEALRDASPKARQEAAVALGELGPAARAAVADLAAKDAAVRVTAAYALAQVGPDAKAAVPALEAMTRAKDGRESSAARHAIGKLKGE